MNPFKRLIAPGLILIVIIALGIAGYMNIEGWSFIESLYMITITLSTVGFREVHTLSEAGRLLTIGVIIFGVGTVAYTVGKLVEIVIEGQIIGYRRKRVMEKQIAEMKNHFIICGFGRVGHQVASEFIEEKIKFVVIDSKPETATELEPQGIPYIVGDMSSDENLEKAGIKKAKGLVGCADSDIANVFVTLSAKVLNPGIFIIARASSKESEEKLKKAGAHRVMSPYLVSGRRMASMAVKPLAMEFLDIMTESKHVELGLGEYLVKASSSFNGKSLQDAQIRPKTGATILAIRKADGKFNLRPEAVSTIAEGDTLISIGTPEQLNMLSKLVK